MKKQEKVLNANKNAEKKTALQGKTKEKSVQPKTAAFEKLCASIDKGRISAVIIQRYYFMGYPLAAKIMDKAEMQGLVKQVDMKFEIVNKEGLKEFFGNLDELQRAPSKLKADQTCKIEEETFSYPDDELQAEISAKPDPKEIAIAFERICSCIDKGHISATTVQRYYHVGYPLAAKIMDMAEAQGLVERDDMKFKIVDKDGLKFFFEANERLNNRTI